MKAILRLRDAEFDVSRQQLLPVASQRATQATSVSSNVSWMAYNFQLPKFPEIPFLQVFVIGGGDVQRNGQNQSCRKKPSHFGKLPSWISSPQYAGRGKAQEKLPDWGIIICSAAGH